MKMKNLLVKRLSLICYRSFQTTCPTFTVPPTITSPSLNSITDDVDIAIAGGGLVGSAMALALASSPAFQNRKILLLESQSKLPQIVSKTQPYSNRVYALSPGTIDLFQKLGAFELMKSIRVQKVAQSLISFDQSLNNDPLAYIVENDVIQYAILERLKALNIQPLLNSKIKQFEYDKVNQNSVLLHFENRSSIRTKLLIASDGYQSTIRELAKISTMKWDYDQFGIVATVQLADDTFDNVVAWQRFLPTGPIALLPLSNTHSSLVWTVPKRLHKKLMSLPAEQFVDEMNKAFTSDVYKRPGVISLTERLRSYWHQALPETNYTTIRQLPPVLINIEPNSRAAFPLSLLNANQYVRPRLALIGDSAHRIHPMAGQGVNMGFTDVQCLTEILESAVRDGADYGSLMYLINYERKRQSNVMAKLISIDSLNRLYSTNFIPLVALRSVGLSFVNEFPSFKNFFAKRAAYDA
ncbi:unnamed protein product [Didymodactylos carnosus]|uniref:Ubiquinone biosynthesis monooxygenase COQ6, mitochondrial n=1 Tax=Didymodactylos carnosus TaxID=1234261 RepID=A0A8S2ENJ6_9BILA|nr:unnamed protein product [Didymodactylos carnosus]CAF4039540.1 unnamed protein product [Didymodactylos carnosus]